MMPEEPDRTRTFVLVLVYFELYLQTLSRPFIFGRYLRSRSQKKVVLAPTMNMTIMLFSRLTV